MTDTPTGPLKGPIFIMGFPRSGTSGLASGLSKLPGFADHGPEGHFIYLLDAPILRIRDDMLNPNSVVRDAGPKAAFLSAIAKGVDDAYCTASGATSRMWIDKTPDVAQVRAIPAIRALFPEAWFFYIYRDAASAVRSNIATWPDQLQGQEMAVAHRWSHCQAEWRKNRDEIPAERRLEIYQPDLRRNPEKVVDDIAALMGLDAVGCAPLLTFWTKNRQVNRPNAGAAAAAYDAVRLDDGVADKVTTACADEMAQWPRLQPLVAETRARSVASVIPAATAPAAAAPVATPAATGHRIAFTGHSFHNRTGSSGFFLDLLARTGDAIDRFDYDTSETFDYTGLLSRSYAHRIFWQSEEILARTRHLFPGRNIVVPMYDAARQRPMDYWHGFAGDLFISFSTLLHNQLQGVGCESVLVQYWPAPQIRAWDATTPLSAFIWDRRPGSDHDAVHALDVCHRLGIPRLHVHLAFDFGGDVAKRRTALRRHCDTHSLNVEVTFSEWYDSRADLATAMHAHPVYFAARSHEGIGMSFLEAMAHGQVVIGPDTATFNEYVANGSNGYLLDAEGRIARDGQMFRDSLIAMSDRTLDSVAEGHAQWLCDAERLIGILQTGEVGGRSDAGAAFARALRIAAGERAAPRRAAPADRTAPPDPFDRTGDAL